MNTEHAPIDHFFRRQRIVVSAIIFVIVALVQLAFIVNTNTHALEKTLAVQAAMTLRLAAQNDGNMNIDPATLPQWQVNPQLLVGCILDKNNQLLASVGGTHVVEAAEVNRLCQEWSARKDAGFSLFDAMFNVTIQNQTGGALGRLVLVGEAPLAWSSVVTAMVFSAVLTALLVAAFFLLLPRLKSASKSPSLT